MLIALIPETLGTKSRVEVEEGSTTRRLAIFRETRLKNMTGTHAGEGEVQVPLE